MISSNKAMEAIHAAEEKARELGITITTVVVDEHGETIATKRMDNALVISPKFAYAKAYTSSTLKVPTSALGDFDTPGKPYYGLTSLFAGTLTSIAGGIPVTNKDKVVGAIGVGGAADVTQDELCAKEAAAVLNS